MRISIPLSVLLLLVGTLATQEPPRVNFNKLQKEAVEFAFPRPVAPLASGESRITLRLLPSFAVMGEQQFTFVRDGSGHIRVSHIEAEGKGVRDQALEWWLHSTGADPPDGWRKVLRTRQTGFDIASGPLLGLLESIDKQPFDDCKSDAFVLDPAVFTLWRESAEKTTVVRVRSGQEPCFSKLYELYEASSKALKKARSRGQ